MKESFESKADHNRQDSANDVVEGQIGLEGDQIGEANRMT
jgi:hypothetical protein